MFDQTIGGKHACQAHRSKDSLLWDIEVIRVECRRGGAAFHWGWLVLFVRALAQNDAAPPCICTGERADRRN